MQHEEGRCAGVITRREMIVAAASAVVGVSGPPLKSSPVVRIRDGRVRGAVIDGINIFLGLPYGADTSGANRFRPPQPVQPWPGIREAVEYGDTAPQSGSQGPQSTARNPDPRRESENCLVLNVHTPGLESRRRPVMVWIHGGSFSTGSGSEPRMNGVNLAKFGDVVVVTLNHRLNALGYLYLAGLGSRYTEMGNVAQLDLVAALSWVRDNIEAFGGDPNNVTIFGVSGGGSKIGILMAMPAARGLFHRAVIQSGAYLQCGTVADGMRGAAETMQMLGVSTVERLQQVPAQMLVDVYLKLRKRALYGKIHTIAPIRDGARIPFEPFSPEAVALSKSVPLMIGCGDTEASNLLVYDGDDSGFAVTFDTLAGKWAAYANSLGAHLTHDEAAGQMSAMRAAYPADTAPLLYFRSVSNLYVIFNTIEICNRRARGSVAPTFLYEITYHTPVDGGKWGAPHGMDVPLIFMNPGKSPLTQDDEGGRAMSRLLARTWTVFARHGNPENALLPPFPPFRADARVAMSLGLTSRAVSDYRGVDLRLMGGLPRLVI